MTRTIENCTLIKKCVKNGLGEPDRFWNINRCEGYQKNEHDDEPCEQCKKCKYCIYREDEE